MLNQVQLIGRLGRDPEVRYMPNGEAVCNFSIATSENWKDANGQKQERTEWHNITMYRKLAEIAGQYLRKGALVFVQGKIQSRKYMGKDGIERTAYEIIGSEMKMLGDTSGGAQQQTTPPAQNQTPPPPPQRQAQAKQPVQPVNDVEDDVPF